MNALAEAGAAIKGNTVKCPWHEDKTASGGIYQDAAGNWRFSCRTVVCGVSGDVWDIEALNKGYASTNDYLRALARFEKPAKPTKSTKPPPPTPPRPAGMQKNAFPAVFSSPESTNAHRVGYSCLQDIENAISAKIGRCTTRYDYFNPNTGIIDFAVCRIDNPLDGGKKQFRPVHQNGVGWVMGAPPKPWPLYRLDLVQDADTVVVVEGEKAAEALICFGIVATTSPSGAGAAKSADWKPLAGKHVILWPDKDEAGEKHMDDVEVILRHLVPRPSVCRLRDVPVPPKGDAFDFLGEPGGEYHVLSEVVQELLDSAESVGASQDVRSLIEATISGQRQAVPWPWISVGDLTQALLPGTITLVCGRPGSAKSFWLLQAMVAWHKAGYMVAVYELEEKRDYHLARVLAQLEGNGNLINTRWVHENPEKARAAFYEHERLLDSFGPCVWDISDAHVTQAELVQWADSRAREGYRIIAIDPITAAEATNKQWIADHEFINGIKRIAEHHGTSIILVTHPKQGVVGRPNQDSLAGGAVYQRLSQSVLWIEQLSCRKLYHCKSNFGTIGQMSTHLVHILKARNGIGANEKLAFTFDDMRFVEHGKIIKEERG